MLLSFIGLYLITGGVSGFEPGYLIVLTDAVFFAMQIILLGRYVKNCDPLVMVTVQVAVCVILKATAFHFISQTMLPASIAAIICSFESVFGLLFSIILLNEQMTILQLTGCLMIFLAMIVSQVEKNDTNLHAKKRLG